MLKRSIFAVIAVFVVWQILDFVIHMVLLQGLYAQTAELWRPMAEMKMGLMVVVGLIASVCFVLVYTLLVNPKNLMAGVKFGAIFGFGTGVSMGYGFYAFMPIPYALAFAWFLGTWVETLAAGLIVGAMVKK